MCVFSIWICPSPSRGASLVAQRLCLQWQRPGFNLWVGKIPWRRERLPTPVFLPGEFHRPWGHKESDTTEWLTHSPVADGVRGPWATSLPPKAGSKRRESVSFLSVSTSHCGLSLERTIGPSSCSMRGQAHTGLPPSPSTSSAGKVVLACCWTSHSLCCHWLCHLLCGPVPSVSDA